MLFFSSFFFFLSFSYTFYEGKHQGIQQSLTYPTEEQRNNKKKSRKKKHRKKRKTGQLTKMTEPRSTSASNDTLFNTEMYNKATKTNIDIMKISKKGGKRKENKEEGGLEGE